MESIILDPLSAFTDIQVFVGRVFLFVFEGVYDLTKHQISSLKHVGQVACVITIDLPGGAHLFNDFVLFHG
jgi:hypothetical protein